MSSKPVKSTGPYANFKEAVMGKSRGNLARPIMKKKPKIVQLRIVKKPQMKQYGDKGYKPSNGYRVGP
jgi:hypothetical protein